MTAFRLAAHRFPGLYRPGLIEARANTRARARAPTGFPGLYRPGLIEARCRTSGGASRWARFRGFTAPASLKQAHAVTARAMATAFPGLYRPGLIEAAGARRRRPSGHGGFRGFTAPASLKPASLRTLDNERLGFRGFTAPASLPARRRARCPSLIRNPRHNAGCRRAEPVEARRMGRQGSGR